mgnify:CR=1 FL=1
MLILVKKLILKLFAKDISEDVYLTRLINADREAFAYFYEKYSPALYQKLNRMVKFSEVADELLQDVFLKVWMKRDIINPTLSFKTWLYTIAQNTVYDYYRKLAQDKKMQEHLISTFAAFYNQTEDYIYNKERSLALQEAIAQLPPQRREIFRLCKIEEKSYKEVAELLNISVSTVSNQLVHATKAVKDYVFFHSKEFLAFVIALYLKN